MYHEGITYGNADKIKEGHLIGLSLSSLEDEVKLEKWVDRVLPENTYKLRGTFLACIISSNKDKNEVTLRVISRLR